MDSTGIKVKLDTRALYAIMVLMLPLSIKVFFEPANTQVIYPGEIFIGLLFLFFIASLLLKRNEITHGFAAFLKHPITILVYCYLAINIISLAFSTMYLVSVKAVIVKVCYVTVFYFMMFYITQGAIQNFIRTVLLFAISMALVAVYTLCMHYKFGLNKANSGYMPLPFFDDHTIYGAALAFLVPLSFGLFVSGKDFGLKKIFTTGIGIAALLFSAAAFYSYSRATWLSLAAMLFFLLLIMMRLRFYGILLFMSAVALIAYMSKDTLISRFKNNKVDSNMSDAGIYEQIYSVTNLTNDMSNVERLNRWHSAWLMFLDKPVTGFGPGTFQFQYLPYQDKKEMSYVSMQEPLPFTTSYHWTPEDGLVLPKGIDTLRGRGGTAHSEYLLALSETGIIGLLLFIGFFLTTLYALLKIYGENAERKFKIISLCLLLSLSTYFVHAFFNNYLDDCKLAFLFWGTISAVTSLDCARKKNNPA